MPLLVIHPDAARAGAAGGRRAAHRPGAHVLRAVGGEAQGAAGGAQPGLADRTPAPSPRRARGTAWGEAMARRALGLPRRSRQAGEPAPVRSPGRGLAAAAGGVRQPRRLPGLPGPLLPGAPPADRPARQRTCCSSSPWSPTGGRCRSPSPGPGRLVLEADGCAEDPDSQRHEPECHAFEVRGLPLTRIELYDVARDPGQVRDISREQDARHPRAAARPAGVQTPTRWPRPRRSRSIPGSKRACGRSGISNRMTMKIICACPASAGLRNGRGRCTRRKNRSEADAAPHRARRRPVFRSQRARGVRDHGGGAGAPARALPDEEPGRPDLRHRHVQPHRQ